MLTISSVAIVTLAGFLAEFGDLKGYDHGQQIIWLAGFNLKENGSGKKKGKSTITKRGRSRLRALLFRAVMPMVAKNVEFKELHQYFTTRSHNPLKKITVASGTLREVDPSLVHARNQAHYVPRKDVLEPVRQARLQMTA